MLLVLAVPYASPRLRWLRVARAPWDREPPELTPAETTPPRPLPTFGEQSLGPTKNEETISNALPERAAQAKESGEGLARAEDSLGIDDPTGHALDAFYASLA